MSTADRESLNVWYVANLEKELSQLFQLTYRLVDFNSFIIILVREVGTSVSHKGKSGWDDDGRDRQAAASIEAAVAPSANRVIDGTAVTGALTPSGRQHTRQVRHGTTAPAAGFFFLLR